MPYTPLGARIPTVPAMLVLSSGSPAIAAAPQTAPATVDLAPTLKPILAKHKTPGLIAAILDGEKVTALGAVGIRKTDAPELMTANPPLSARRFTWEGFRRGMDQAVRKAPHM